MKGGDNCQTLQKLFMGTVLNWCVPVGAMICLLL